MHYQKRTDILEHRTVWIISFENNFQNNNLTLLLSKISEAILPNTPGNHIGDGSTMDDFIQKQPGVKFIINGGFNHYRKNFYDWPHQDFNVGDPVGLIKVREHYFEDFIDIAHYGFFIQEEKFKPWKIVQYEQLKKTEKYILGCTPLLIHNKIAQYLPVEKMQSIPEGSINPPSILGHGLQHHPRTSVGTKNNELFFILVEEDLQFGGCTLPELQDIGKKLNLENFLNLDGGRIFTISTI